MATRHEGFIDMIVEEDDDGVLLVTLNRPEKLNALSPGMRRSLREIAPLAAARDSVKAVVITGAGRGFCSGADLAADASGPYMPVTTHAQRKETSYTWVADLRALDKPVLAAVNGSAVGAGLSIALACDLRFASETARFGAAFVRRGLVPDNGASYFLPRMLGPSRALRLLWTGALVDAAEALRLGMVDEVVAPEELLPRALEFARELAHGASVAIDLTKRLVYRGLEHDLRAAGELEELFQGIARGTEDVVEGRLAFQEKREPRFKGR